MMFESNSCISSSNSPDRFDTQLLITLINFRKECLAVLSRSDLVHIDLWIDKLNLLTSIPIVRDHYINCPGALDPFAAAAAVDIPDTCACNTCAIIDHKFELLRKEYGISML